MQCGFAMANWSPSGVPSLGWATGDWKPPIIGTLAFAAVGCGLLLAPTRPAIGVSVFLVCAYSLPRYEPGLEWVYRHGIIENAAFLSFWATLLSNRPKTSLGVWLVAAYAGWIILRSIPELLVPSTFLGDLKHSPLRYLSGCCLAYASSVALRESVSWKFIVGTLTVSLAIHFILLETVDDAAEFAFISVAACPLLASYAPLSGSSFSAILWRILSVLAAVAVIATANRGAAIGLAVCLITWWIYSRCRLLIVIALIVVTAVSLDHLAKTRLASRMRSAVQRRENDPTIASRLRVWEAASIGVQRNLIVGHGAGQGPRVIAKLRNKNHDAAVHNTFIAVIIELGIIGFTIWTVLICHCMYLGWALSAPKHWPWPAATSRAVMAGMVGLLVTGVAISRQDDGLTFILMGAVLAMPNCVSKQ